MENLNVESFASLAQDLPLRRWVDLGHLRPREFTGFSCMLSETLLPRVSPSVREVLEFTVGKLHRVYLTPNGHPAGWLLQATCPRWKVVPQGVTLTNHTPTWYSKQDLSYFTPDVLLSNKEFALLEVPGVMAAIGNTPKRDRPF